MNTEPSRRYVCAACKTPIIRGERCTVCGQGWMVEESAINVEVRASVQKMVQVYSTIHPRHLHDPDLRWEMRIEMAEAFTKEFNIATPITEDGPIAWVCDNRDNLEFLGIKIDIVERDGIRLVFKVV